MVLALKSTRWALDLATKLIKANVRVHNIDAIEDEHAIIFAGNHFTRLETFLLPYIVYRETGREVWALGAARLFAGRLGRYLRSMGTVSTSDPDRDKTIINSLLEGNHPWLIFPEGRMVKDKKVLDHRRRFSVYEAGARRAPHTGAAVLALRTEFYRRKIARLAEAAAGDPKALDMLLARFKLASAEPVLGKRTVIIPVNISYFPVRSRENLFLRLAKRATPGLSDRMLEELSVEGTVLASDTDIDITFGDPIDTAKYLDGPGMDMTEAALEIAAADPESPFPRAARRLMGRYMRAIYHLGVVNHDDVFASLARYQHASRTAPRVLRQRAFLATHRLAEADCCRLHEELSASHSDLVTGLHSARLDDFLALCEQEGVYERGAEMYIRHTRPPESGLDFHQIRRRALTYVIANELEPLSRASSILRGAARMPERVLGKTVRDIIQAQDLRAFQEAYAQFSIEDESKEPSVGRPFLLTPRSIRGGVVLIHGYMAAPLEVRALAEHLAAQGYAVYGVRLAGHGTAPEDLAQTPWEAWLESAGRGYAILSTLTPNIHFGGFSMGGVIALVSTALRGEAAKSVFAICAPYELRSYAARLASTIVTMNQLLNRVGGSGPWYVENSPENRHINYVRNPIAGVKQLGEAMAAMKSRLAEIRVPALVMQADNDPTVHPISGQRIFDGLGTEDKKLIEVPSERHGIVNDDGSPEVFAHVTEFLARVSSPVKTQV